MEMGTGQSVVMEPVVTKMLKFAVGRIRTYAPRGKLISSQSP